MSLPREGQFIGCLVGQCLGDALGFLVEGRLPEACRHYVDEILKKDEGRLELAAGPRFGQYSDDGQLARELLQSYVSCRRFDPSDYAKGIAAIFMENRIVGRGHATSEAAWRLASGVSWEEAGSPSPYAGNGSAMRAGPIGLIFFDEPERLIRAAHDQSRITHQDLRCSAGAVAIAGAVALALRAVTIEPARIVSTLSDWTRELDPILSNALKHQMQGWIQLPPEDAADQIPSVGLEPDNWDERKNISPFVTTSVLWSLYSFLRAPDDYWKAICTAIGVGGDVDSTASMTGAISGAKVGLDGMPQDLARCLRDFGTWQYGDLVDLARESYSIRMGDSSRLKDQTRTHSAIRQPLRVR